MKTRSNETRKLATLFVAAFALALVGAVPSAVASQAGGDTVETTACGSCGCADKADKAHGSCDKADECKKKDGDCACGADKAAKKAPVAFDEAPAVGTKATCPVMGGEFTVTEKTLRSEYKGKHYAFCCPACKPKFDKDPEKYLSKKE